MARYPLDIPGGVYSDNTTHAEKGRWADINNVRFRLGKPQTIAGWEALTSSTLTGVCRWVFPWGDNDNQLDIAFGTHTNLYVYQGGGLYDITPSSGFTAGQIDGTGQSGYGTGPYGAGGYATPSTEDYFPLTWSGGASGQDLIASPRNQGIFKWDATDTGVVAATLTNSPAVVSHCLVSNKDAVFALGCTEEGGSTFNALAVRHSGIGVPTEWNTAANTTSRQYILPGGGRIVGGRNLGEDHVLVWTNAGLFRFDYVGELTEVYRWSEVGRQCGLIGPGAAVVQGQTAYWISPDRQFWTYTLGGVAEILPCPIREDFAENLSFAQSDKIVASTVGEHGEVWWDYPDSRDGYENSRYVAVPVMGPDAGSWFRGQMARTARVDAGPSPYPLAVSTAIDGTDAVGTIYWHERGSSADGDVLTWFIESADQFMSENNAMLVRSFWPDAEYQTGPVTLTFTARMRQRGDEVVKTYTIASDDDKTDTRVSGRLLRIKFSGSASPSAFRLGLPVMDMVPTGIR